MPHSEIGLFACKIEVSDSVSSFISITLTELTGRASYSFEIILTMDQTLLKSFNLLNFTDFILNNCLTINTIDQSLWMTLLMGISWIL